MLIITQKIKCKIALVDKPAFRYNYIVPMRFIARLIFSFFSNLIALGAAAYFVPGFSIAPDLINFLGVAGIFTLINVFIKPVLRLVLTPIILITFGLGIIFVNMLTLYFLDFLSVNITIGGPSALLYSSLIIALINILINFSAKKLYQEND